MNTNRHKCRTTQQHSFNITLALFQVHQHLPHSSSSLIVMPHVRRQHRIYSEATDTVKINFQLRRNFQWIADTNKYLACSSVGALELGQNHARRMAAIDLFNRCLSSVNM